MERGPTVSDTTAYGDALLVFSAFPRALAQAVVDQPRSSITSLL